MAFSEDIEIYSVNCDACGEEHFNTEVHTVKLAGVDRVYQVCDRCFEQTAEQSFKGAAEVVCDIAKIAADKCDPEERLVRIKQLLGS